MPDTSQITQALVTPILQDLVIDVDGDCSDLNPDNSLNEYVKTCTPTPRTFWLSGLGSEDVEPELIPKLGELKELTTQSDLTVWCGPEKKADQSNGDDERDDSDETEDLKITLPRPKIILYDYPNSKY
ncbi:hypothetical protein BDZ97DRAFT_2056926 [Flammula alnicola]|nr:hypothetical protein BDZ97DRAFT_2056926 [Flammula alnicola]